MPWSRLHSNLQPPTPSWPPRSRPGRLPVPRVGRSLSKECLQAALSLPAADQGLLGSAWDSWSSNPYLDRQQVEEQPGFYPFEEP